MTDREFLILDEYGRVVSYNPDALRDRGPVTIAIVGPAPDPLPPPDATRLLGPSPAERLIAIDRSLRNLPFSRLPWRNLPE